MRLREKKKKLKSLIRFHSANKIDSYNKEGEGGRKRKKIQRIYRTSQNIRIINVFLESLLSESFPSLGVTVHLTSLGCPPTLCWSWACCRGSSDSNLVLLLCVLASSVCSYQLVHFLLWELSMTFFVFHRHRICLVDCVDLICSLYSWWGGFGSSLATLPLGFNCGFISTSAGRSSTGLYSWGCPGGLGSAPVRARYGGGAAAWVAGFLESPDTQGSWQLGQQEI